MRAAAPARRRAARGADRSPKNDAPFALQPLQHQSRIVADERLDAARCRAAAQREPRVRVLAEEQATGVPGPSFSTAVGVESRAQPTSPARQSMSSIDGS